MTELFDLIVIGAGTASQVAAEIGALGRKVALVERDLLGGTCPNRGCIPTKILVTRADQVREVRRADRFGLDVELRAIDGDAILAEMRRRTMDATDARMERSLSKHVTIVRGEARFRSARTISVGGRELTAERIVVATGSRPALPPIDGLREAGAWTSDEAVRAESVPESLTIVGGGYIGCELAHVFGALGSRVTVLEGNEALLSREDAEVRDVFRRGFEAAGIAVRTGVRVERVRRDGDDFLASWKDGSGRTGKERSTRLLVATGRVPNVEELGLEQAGVRCDDDGFIAVDDDLATSAAGIWAAGDVIGGYMLTHTGVRQARHLVRVLSGEDPGPLDMGPIAHAVFTWPQVAAVGATEDEAKAADARAFATSMRYDEVAMGSAIEEEHGLFKLVLGGDGAILGAHAVGRHAAILIHEVVVAMRWHPHVEALDDVVHVHPALNEIVSKTAAAARRELAERKG